MESQELEGDNKKARSVSSRDYVWLTISPHWASLDAVMWFSPLPCNFDFFLL